MDQDRRASIRRQADLPFAWCRVAPGATVAEVCEALGVPAALALQSRLAELDQELKRLCTALPDTRVEDALRVLDAKVAVLEEALLSQSPLPPARSVAVSAEGLGFDSADALPVGACVGIHLVLPAACHVLCRGRVSHCAEGAGVHHVGVSLEDLEATVARRLTRYAIARDHD